MSDSNNTHAYKIKLLDRALSYPSWAIKMLDILMDQELDVYIKGSKQNKLTGEVPEIEAWE